MRIDRSEEVATPRHSIPFPPPLPFLLTFDSITHRVGFRRADALYPRSIAVEIETSLLERCAENSPTIGMLWYTRVWSARSFLFEAMESLVTLHHPKRGFVVAKGEDV